MTIGVRRTAVGLAGLLVIGAQFTGGAAARTQSPDVSAAYQCGFPGGQQQATVRITTTFPDSVTGGGSVQPGPVTAAVTVNQGALDDLSKLGASAVAETGQLTVNVTQNGSSSPVTWPKLTGQAVALPGQGDLTLTMTGGVPPVPAGPSGALTFTAGGLDLALALQKKDGSTVPLPVACTPTAAQGGPALATVPVTQAPAPSAPAKAPAATPPVPDGCTTLKPTPDYPRYGCVYMSGYSNVAKLDAAMPLNDPALPNPALVSLRFRLNLSPVSISAQFQFVKPIRARSTFLAFGFMPTTATMELDQVGLGTEVGVPYPNENTGFEQITAKMQAYIRLYDVSVNGTPLNVGAQCKSAQPADITLHDLHSFGNPTLGGVLDGTFRIPGFKGCGVGEDLDPMFNGAVAGDGNHLKITQGAMCPRNCPPVVPVPQR